MDESLVLRAAPDGVAVWVAPWWRAMVAAERSVRCYGWARGWREGTVARDLAEAGRTIRALAERMGSRWPRARVWVRAVQAEGRAQFYAARRASL